MWLYKALHPRTDLMPGFTYICYHEAGKFYIEGHLLAAPSLPLKTNPFLHVWQAEEQWEALLLSTLAGSFRQ